MVEGRSNGRLVRRRKRIEKMRAKEAVAREERQARKELVKVTLLIFWYLCIVASLVLLVCPCECAYFLDMAGISLICWFTVQCADGPLCLQA